MNDKSLGRASPTRLPKGLESDLSSACVYRQTESADTVSRLAMAVIHKSVSRPLLLIFIVITYCRSEGHYYDRQMEGMSREIEEQ